MYQWRKVILALGVLIVSMSVNAGQAAKQCRSSEECQTASKAMRLLEGTAGAVLLGSGGYGLYKAILGADVKMTPSKRLTLGAMSLLCGVGGGALLGESLEVLPHDERRYRIVDVLTKVVEILDKVLCSC